ncbi:PucR family transcriptional regulator [Nocardia nepalensis]|uniref:PucR family transcriptional regulator n=1 Tax=Nocardia nepalensis TaxID=3375448 RepID=UPI003B679609
MSGEIAPATEHIVRHLLDTVAPRHRTPGSVLREEISSTVATCLDLLADGFEEPSDRMSRIRGAATRWAGVGFPIDAVHRLVQEGFRLHLEAHVLGAVPKLLQYNDIRRLVDALHAVTAAVSLAYLETVSAVPTTDDPASRAVAVALLDGHRPSKIAREYGVTVADSYTVLAVAVDGRAAKPMPGSTVPQRVRNELALLCGEPVPALISARGGTILVPGIADHALDDLVSAVTSIRATAVLATSEQIPAAARLAHELLDIVQRLRARHGLYHFDELAVEYQLTRPGPGRDRLAALLDPLEDYPELFQTLREHIRNDLNRRLTSQSLHIHQNTIDHRLKRIGQLTGLDATGPTSLWRLRAALIARNYTRPDSV